MTQQQLAIKVYDIDYSFIIKNYLDKSLWHKEWTLFVYKDVSFTISLWKIDVTDESISFKVRIRKGRYSDYDNFWFYTQQSTVKILQQQIDGMMFRLMERLESYLIRDEDEYQEISDGEWDEREVLRRIAENFLDENGVTNDEIREVYIDNYVSNNSKTSEYLADYERSRQYLVLSDLYLTFTEVTEDDARQHTVMNKIQDYTYCEEIIKNAREYINKINNEDQDLYDDLSSCLEAI